MSSIVIAPNWLGDAILSLGALRRLVSEDPETTVAVRGHLAPVFQGFRTTLLPPPRQAGSGREGLRLMRLLRPEGFERAFVLAPSLRAVLLARASGAPVTIGFGGRRLLRRMLLSHPLRRPPRSEHQWSHYLYLVEAFLGEGPRPLPTIELQPARALNRGRPLVVLCPGARYGPAKRWPVTRFAELARRLVAELGADVAVAGTREDSWAERVIAARADSRVSSLVGKTSLGELMSHLGQAHAVVSNDSGAMHLAAAVGTPVVGLFGSSSPSWTGPLGDRHRVLYRPPDCSPCYQPECRYGHYSCLHAISVEEALEATAQILGNRIGRFQSA